MTLDDVYGSEHDRFPLEQERVPVVCALDWGEMTNRAAWSVSPPVCTVPDAAVPDAAVPDAAVSRPPVAVLLQAPRRAA